MDESLPFPCSNVTAFWGYGNQLFVCDGTKAAQVQKYQSIDDKQVSQQVHNASSGRSNGTIHQVRSKVYQGEIRKLLLAWHRVFSTVQRPGPEQRNPNGGRWLDFLLAQSRRYRAELTAWIRDRRREMKDPGNITQDRERKRMHDLSKVQDEREIDAEYLKTLELMEHALSVWHLSEIILVDPHENITNQLRLWLWDGASEDSVLDESHPRRYLADINMLVAKGKIQQAKAALLNAGRIFTNSAHYLTERVPVDMLVQALDRMPISTQPNGSNGSFQGLSLLFRRWQDLVHSFREAVTEDMYEEVGDLLDIMLGDTVITERYCNKWQELLVAELLFRRPACTRAELSGRTLACMRRQKVLSGSWQDEAASTMDQLSLDIINQNLGQVMSMIHQIFDFDWFSAHLCDLLVHALVGPNLSDTTNPAYDNDSMRDLQSWTERRNYFVMEYASNIGYQNGLLQVSATYFVACGQEGHARLSQLVTRQPIGAMKEAMKLLSFCDRYQLPNKPAILSHLGMEALRKRQYSNAVYWLVQAQHTRALDMIVDYVIQQHIVTGDLATVEAVVEIVSEDLIKDAVLPSLAFIVKYWELCQLCDRLLGEREPVPPQHLHELLRQALEIVLRLLASNIAPQKWWWELLKRAGKLLSLASSAVLDSEDIFVLMRALEYMRFPHFRSLHSIDRAGEGDSKDSKAGSVSKFIPSEQDVAAIRLILVRSVSMAVRAHEGATPKTAMPQAAAASSNGFNRNGNAVDNSNATNTSAPFNTTRSTFNTSFHSHHQSRSPHVSRT